MSLATLKRASTGDANERFSDAQPAAVSLDADGLCTVVYGNSAIKRDARYKPEMARGPSIDDLRRGVAATEDRKAIERTGPGDVVILTAARIENGKLIGDRVAARIHDGLRGRVQVAYALAKPTRTSVSKRGMTQWMHVIDPSAARMVATREQMLALVKEMYARPWPGGEPGLLLRDAREFHEVQVEKDGARRETPEAFVERLVGVNDILASGSVEAMPKWTLPMGREQVMRERIDSRKETASAVEGAFTGLWPNKGRERAYLPTALILGDEEEWAFGAGTGKSHRVVLGAHPMSTTRIAYGMTVASSVRKAKTETPYGISLRFNDEQLDAAVKARASRRPAETSTMSAKSPATAFAGMKATAPAIASAAISERPVTPAPTQIVRRPMRPGRPPLAVPQTMTATPEPSNAAESPLETQGQATPAKPDAAPAAQLLAAAPAPSNSYAPTAPTRLPLRPMRLRTQPFAPVAPTPAPPRESIEDQEMGPAPGP